MSFRFKGTRAQQVDRLKKVVPISKDAVNQIWWQARQFQRQKALKFPSIHDRRLKDEVKKLHLVGNDGQTMPMMDLKCAECKKEHPDNPRPLRWWKSEKRKGDLKCPFCGCNNFVHTNRKKPQGEMVSEIIEKRSNILRRHIESEVGDVSEGRKYERKFGVKIV